MTNTLQPGQELHPGDTLYSPRGNAVLIFQHDGNLVLYRGQGNFYNKDSGTYVGVGYWHTGTFGHKEITRAVMQTDGNFVLYDNKGHSHWSAVPGSHKPGSVLVLQDDGNMVLYNGRNAVWSSETAGFPDRLHPDSGGLFGWAGNVVQTAGHVAGDAIHTVNKVNGDITGLIQKVPVVGPVYHAVWDANVGFVFSVADDVAAGKRLDQVGMAAFQRQISDVQEVAPYVETVMTFVPGVGPEVSAAIGCSVALAEGKTIDQALLAGVRAAIPGGAIAQAAFDTSTAVLRGESAGEIGLTAVEGIANASGVQVPPQAKQVLASGLRIARDMAHGQSITDAALNEAIRQLPQSAQNAAQAARSLATGKSVGDVIIETGQKMIPGLSQAARDGLRKGLTVGMCMGNAGRLQEIINTQMGGSDMINRLSMAGDKVVKGSADAMQAMGLAKGSEHGFQIALGLMTYNARGQSVLLAVRDKLSSQDKMGFDMGCSYHAGRVTNKAVGIDTRVNAAYFITMGLRGHAPGNKAAMMRAIASDKRGRRGAVIAAKEVAKARGSWLHRIWAWFHFPHRKKDVTKLPLKAKQAIVTSQSAAFMAQFKAMGLPDAQAKVMADAQTKALKAQLHA